MTLDESKEEDVIKEIEGYKFAVDGDLDRQIEGVTVDYKEGLLRKGFVIYMSSGGGSC